MSLTQVIYKKRTIIPEDELVQCLEDKRETNVTSAEFLCDVLWLTRHIMGWSALPGCMLRCSHELPELRHGWRKKQHLKPCYSWAQRPTRALLMYRQCSQIWHIPEGFLGASLSHMGWTRRSPPQAACHTAVTGGCYDGNVHITVKCRSTKQRSERLLCCGTFSNHPALDKVNASFICQFFFVNGDDIDSWPGRKIFVV